MGKPTNGPSREPIYEPTKQLGQDAMLSVNLSTPFCRLFHDKKTERVMFCDQKQEQDNEIPSKLHESSNT